MANSLRSFFLIGLAICALVFVAPLPALATTMPCDFKFDGVWFIQFQVDMVGQGDDGSIQFEDKALVFIPEAVEVDGAVLTTLDQLPIKEDEFFHLLLGRQVPKYAMEVMVYLPDDDAADRWPARITTPKMEGLIYGECIFREI